MSGGSGGGYRYCFVLSCLNNSKKHANKYFFRVPYNQHLRDEWSIAIGRTASSLKQSSTAFCCSDHFDLEKDLDPLYRNSNFSVCPKLHRDAVPSLNHKNIEKRNEKTMESLRMFGSGALTNETVESSKQQHENVYVREVVYIQENHDERFLQENIETEDFLTIESDEEEVNNVTSETIGRICDEQNVLESVPPAILPARPSFQNRWALANSKVVSQYETLKNKITKTHISVKHPNQLKVAVKHNQPLVSSGQMEPSTSKVVQKNMFNNSGVLNAKAIQMPVNYQLTKRLNVPVTTTSKPVTIVSKPFPVRIRNPITVKSNVVNKLKYFNKSKNQPNNYNGGVQTEDEDCIVVDEQNMLKINDKAVVPTNSDSSIKLLTTLPSSISVKVSRAVAFTPQQVPIRVPTNIHELVQAQPNLQVREFSNIGGKQNVNQDKVFKLIQLMLSENQMLLSSKKGNRVKISRTKHNEFKIFDSVYYYRTNDQFEKNYFFLNITRNSRHSNEIIQRNYGIYWGNPRVSCVGIVETKGVLDDQTKNFVFQQVKKSLFNENGEQNLKLLNVVQSIQHVQENSASTHKPTAVSPAPRPTNEASAITNFVNDTGKIIQPNTVGLRRNNKPPTPPSSHIKNILPIRRTTKMVPTPVPTTAIPKTTQDIAQPTNDLIRLSTFLTPGTRKLINKLKYFELNNGSVYTVNIGPFCPAKKKPFDIVFTENQPKSKVQPVSKDLYVSKLVNYLFRAIYPFMHRQSAGPIPIVKPQNIPSDFTAEMMESLIVSETTRIDEEIEALTASMKPPPVKNLKRVKHLCDVCSESFERKYELKRHQFVRHNSDSGVPSTTSTISVATNHLEERLMRPVKPCPSDSEIMSIIKTEIPDDTILSDQSLLIPLFEVPINEVQNQDNSPGDFSLVKCKEEPEEYFEVNYDEIALKCKEEVEEVDFEMQTAPINKMPLSIVQPKRNARKRKACNDDGIYEDTDSAQESIVDNSSKSFSERKQRKLSKDGRLSSKLKREEIKKTKHLQNVLEKRPKTSFNAVESKKRVSIKISEAKKFMCGWRTLTVDLVDIGRLGTQKKLL